MITDDQLLAFIRESNKIEGITEEPLDREIGAYKWFLGQDVLRQHHVEVLVGTIQPGARLRDQPGMNVQVGDHVPPAGGHRIVALLGVVLDQANGGESAYRVHLKYENLHPFMDGNGRSGRAIWLWQMLRKQGGAPLGFLHHFYYQTLEAQDDR